MILYHMRGTILRSFLFLVYLYALAVESDSQLESRGRDAGPEQSESSKRYIPRGRLRAI